MAQNGKLDSQNSGKCDNCKYRVSKQERILYDCGECGSYIVSNKHNTNINLLLFETQFNFFSHANLWLHSFIDLSVLL